MGRETRTITIQLIKMKHTRALKRNGSGQLTYYQLGDAFLVKVPVKILKAASPFQLGIIMLNIIAYPGPKQSASSRQLRPSN
ncbi:hypothetical protein NPIL_451171 [Nephila pilipes]|uniref:Uncharacterized protein n=1 Tax=Nephila pilipes TaxID=299642 RepID=A0A8X6NEM2_NEPPI|nr:hypothetical protein NPIL_451171 [Nephila pilipes]